MCLSTNLGASLISTSGPDVPGLVVFFPLRLVLLEARCFSSFALLSVFLVSLLVPVVGGSAGSGASNTPVFRSWPLKAILQNGAVAV